MKEEKKNITRALKTLLADLLPFCDTRSANIHSSINLDDSDYSANISHDCDCGGSEVNEHS